MLRTSRSRTVFVHIQSMTQHCTLLQALPDVPANRILALLLARKALSAGQLALFRRCVTSVSLPQNATPDMLPALSDFRCAQPAEVNTCARNTDTTRQTHAHVYMQLPGFEAFVKPLICQALNEVRKASGCQS